MNCYYCDKISTSDPGYASSPASHDLGSEAPRCARHWRYVCGECGEPSHFMSTGYDTSAGKLFCSGCATDREQAGSPFWAWSYYFRYRSPWSEQWSPALDRLEYEGRHPSEQAETRQAARGAISSEEYLVRYPLRQWNSTPDREFSDADVRANWNVNAERWDALYDEDGDRNRKYQSDEPMLELLGDVRGKRVLDVGSGNGYLCRKLAKAGAATQGIEISDQFVEMAEGRERKERLGIDYHQGSASDMGFLPDGHFDLAVANYVLMDIQDYTGALRHIYRVLRRGGRFVAVISHPSFQGAQSGWVWAVPDSPRREDRLGWRTDMYFHRGPTLEAWGNLDPVLSFHRPLRDYWQAFVEAGFTVHTFEEPSIAERGRRELPIWSVEQSLRIPYSCIFRLVKPGE